MYVVLLLRCIVIILLIIFIAVYVSSQYSADVSSKMINDNSGCKYGMCQNSSIHEKIENVSVVIQYISHWFITPQESLLRTVV